MTGERVMGSPFPLTTPPPTLLVHSVGDFEDHEGAQVVIRGHEVVFEARTPSAELAMGVPITFLLEQLAAYTKAHES